ncbi:hypothetical protein AXF42_Ash015293 [Apostasia shenzhenica]|uniref:Uncharacterized protein n=1 Tax=Apostasia shenzhenica TaxID=1088818 RepID=A0A2I0ALU5_9ASPA|nr:hypothetical protein AXF42_Ash015293 [Apostasia shenzhenica]
MEHLPFLLCFFFFISSLLHFPPAMADTHSGSIHRLIKQQILAAIAPGDPHSSEVFLTSPSGKYAAYFLRSRTAPAAGGFGNDFCFIQIVDTASAKSAWESECTPVSTANTCSLVFDDAGLEVFDGSREAWSTAANGFHPNVLQLVDHGVGDMRITDKNGELTWKASDDPRSNQGCGLPGSPGLSPKTPPFAGQIGASGSLPFGQTAPASNPAQLSVEEDGRQPEAATAPASENHPPPAAEPEANQPVSPVVAAVGEHAGELPEGPVGAAAAEEGGELTGQPLVDSTPYDSGSVRGVEIWGGMGSALAALAAPLVAEILI